MSEDEERRQRMSDVPFEEECDRYRVIPLCVTRVDIVGQRGGSQEFWADEWEVRVQDGGHTVKLFAKGDGGKARNERNASLAKELEGTPR